MGATRRFSAIGLCLAFALGLFGALAPAAAQQQEKRIALVVGNGAYSKAPLATTANDAGLIAQTLQAAGFDVIGARDLDGDTLRRTLRDFIQKAESSGPDTVAMIYLAGYGLQLAGENYFIPVDSSVAREADIPTEGLRINDYVRRLGSLSLKASIVVLDAARQQPFVEGGQPIAGGLALVEPEPRMLIAFNAAPGTVAPVEQGPYGAYGQALAEMIRTGGLPLPELFDRLRLRVNEASKGAQVPWHAQKLDTNFVFFDRAPDAPAPATSDQATAVRSRPIRELGPRDAYAAALERDTLQGYDEFVAAYPGDPLSRRMRALAAARREAITWMRTYRADTPQAYWSYLRRYPNGPHAADARRRLAILTAPLEPPPAFAVIDYDVPPPPPEEIVYVDRPVVLFSDPYYDFAPPPPPPVYFLPPPPPDFVILAPPPPPIGLFILPQPVFVAMPVYVRAPVYVAPPPNNIIFANIHNTTVINNVINRPPAPGAGQGAPGGSAPIGAKGGMQGMAAGAASPALPPSVAQKATLIQQGKAPVPPSASINPAALKSGVPPTGQGGAVQNMLPANAPAVTPQGQQLPKANALPVPGAKGAPPLPPAGTAAAPANPKIVTPPGTKPGIAPTATAPTGPAGPTPPKGAGPTPGVVGSPKAGGTPPAAGSPPKPGSAALAPPPSTAPPKPGVTSIAKPPPGPPPSVRATPPSQVSRPVASPPPARVAAPSPPPARMSAPPPPPPRISAPPPPAARMAAPPPPPPPRMAAPPPPRPMAPPPVVKRCPPNAPKC